MNQKAKTKDILENEDEDEAVTARLPFPALRLTPLLPLFRR